MRKFANFLWIDKEGENYTIRMTPELQDDVGTNWIRSIQYGRSIRS